MRASMEESVQWFTTPPSSPALRRPESMALLGMTTPPSSPALRRPSTTPGGMRRSGSSGNYGSLGVRSAAVFDVESSRLVANPTAVRRISRESSFPFLPNTLGALRNRSC